jgi:hypothetical protein
MLPGAPPASEVIDAQGRTPGASNPRRKYPARGFRGVSATTG